MAPSRRSLKTAEKPASSRRLTQASGDGGAADAVDQQLARYREMRDFSVTEEPIGSENKKRASATKLQSETAAPKASLPFVIQKHDASHLHYDFRLGWNGVLKSWAVAKGPSYYTGDRRLAVQVEDHPIEYGGFEGVIPKGQYGGGTVMVWDQGTWAPQPGHEDIDEGLEKGSLKFLLYGTKMHGKWTLVRMNNTGGSGRWHSSTKPNWLLIKEHDDYERGPNDPAVTEKELNSAVTGRTMDQIASQEDHVWNSKETAQGNSWYRKNEPPQPALTPSKRPAKETTAKASSSAYRGLPKEKQPDFIKPQLALEVEVPPSEKGWLHELKLDGYRIQARKTGKKVALLTRSGLDWTHRVPQIAKAIAELPVGDATFDGEAVVLAENGTTNFAALQAAFQEGAKSEISYFCFDLLHVEGHNPRELPLEERKKMLGELLAQAGENDTVRLSEHLSSGGKEVFDRACELHAEGIVSKRADRPYLSGRSGAWLKAKCLHEQEFVVGGYTLSSDGGDRIGSLLLGYYRGKDLIYAGRTGTGFNQKMRRLLLQTLQLTLLKTPPFARVPTDARRGALWVEPKLIAQVRFATWTAEDLVRQASFLGLREDKAPSEVCREDPTVAPRPKRNAGGTKSESSNSTPVKRASAKGRHTHSDASSGKAAMPAVRLTHPNKVVDPQTGLTKAQLAEYYWSVADWMLPHVADRPLSLVRCPEGAGKPCFYQKHVNHMLPPGVTTVDVPDKKTGIAEPYITLSSSEALAGLAQMGVLEIHPWGSCNANLEHPDRLILDIDPDESLPWLVVCEAAGEIRARLNKAGLESFLKTTGGKGLHVVIPIVPELGWAEIKTITHTFVSKMERSRPTLYLTKMTKSARKGKIYLDYLRNERGATAVAPYSPRARLGTQVSLPLPWSALRSSERPVFSVSNFSEWRSSLRTNPWKKLVGTRQHLIMERIESL